MESIVTTDHARRFENPNVKPFVPGSLYFRSPNKKTSEDGKGPKDSKRKVLPRDLSLQTKKRPELQPTSDPEASGEESDKDTERSLCIQQLAKILQLEGVTGCTKPGCRYEHLEDVFELEEKRAKRELTSKKLGPDKKKLAMLVLAKLIEVRGWSKSLIVE
jgi:hypothetical protein